MNDKKTFLADISLLAVAAIWGSSFVVTKSTLDHITPFYLLAFRFTIATALLGVVSFKRLKRAKTQDIKAGLIIGSMMLLGFLFQTIGLINTTVGVNSFIVSANVVMVPFFYWLLTKRKPDNYETFGAIMCFIGIGVLSLDGNLRLGFGELLSLGSALFFALQIVAVGYYARESDVFVISTVQMAFAAAAAFILANIFEPKITNFNTDMMLPIVYLAVFSSMIAFLLQNIAQARTSSAHAAIILSTEALFGSVMGVIFLKETVTVKFLIGCIAILASVIISEVKPNPSKLKKQKTPA
jgi:drug/metabolite transporter (DMT)-like permease